MKKTYRKVVLAYSGGLDTSVIIPWLKETYGCEVVAMVADVGQGEELEGIEEKALNSGASQVFVEDVRREFVQDCILPALRAGAVYEGKYLLGTALARPIIARRQVEVAHRVGADAVAHGATGKGNDQVRFELAYKALAPELAVIAPWREWTIRSREDAMAYAAARGIPVPVTKAKPYSMDRNLWHISYEGGILEDPWAEPPADMFRWTAPPEQAPGEPEYVEIGFEAGFPVSVNGTVLDPVALVETLNAIGARHGVGRIDIVENRLVGMKSRGVYETPGGTLLHTAHRELERLTLDRDTMRFKETVALRYAELVYYGQWFTPLRAALDAFVASTQRPVTGTVRLKVFKGQVSVAGRRSPYSLYSEELATFGADAVYNQADAAGFINLFGLPISVQARLGQKMAGEAPPTAVEARGA
ncbi:MAG: argininosuccinate synthase [Limnochordales bacterium]|nr:MAG: argininosuccinate synthase [Bacillota bacterium]HLT57179.1 argininosuccinate synthase [Limnochordales bacterium]